MLYTPPVGVGGGAAAFGGMVGDLRANGTSCVNSLLDGAFGPVAFAGGGRNGAATGTGTAAAGAPHAVVPIGCERSIPGGAGLTGLDGALVGRGGMLSGTFGGAALVVEPVLPTREWLGNQRPA